MPDWGILCWISDSADPQPTLRRVKGRILRLPYNEARKQAETSQAIMGSPWQFAVVDLEEVWEPEPDWKQEEAPT